jgi:hypothetical protein
VAKRNSRYRGELNKPIIAKYPRNLGLAAMLMQDATLLENWRIQNKKMSQTVRETIERRLHLLAKHYDRTWPGDSELLVRDLASAHLRGFQIREVGISSRKIWTFGRLMDLNVAVETTKRETKHKTDKAACEHIAKEGPFPLNWGPPTNHKGTRKAWARTLVSRLHDARAEAAQVKRIANTVAS